MELAHADSASPVYFSADGKHMAFKLTRGEERRAIIDGVEGEPYESLSNQILFSPDGKHVLYRATRGGHQMMVLDGVESKLRGVISENDFGFGPQGRSAYILRDGSGYRVVIDGSPSSPYDRIIGEPWFSRDGSRVAFAAGLDRRRQLVVLDGAELEAFDDIKLRVTFSPDGKRYCYAATRGGIEYAVIDGGATGYEIVEQVLIGPTGKHTAVVGKRAGKWVIDVDRVRGNGHDETLHGCFFSPDGEHITCVADKGQRQLVVTDGIEGSRYDSVTDLHFIAGGSHVVHLARRNNKSLAVLDGAESVEYDALMMAPAQEDGSSPVAVDPTKPLRFLAIRSGEYFRVEIRGF